MVVKSQRAPSAHQHERADAEGGVHIGYVHSARARPASETVEAADKCTHRIAQAEGTARFRAEDGEEDVNDDDAARREEQGTVKTALVAARRAASVTGCQSGADKVIPTTPHLHMSMSPGGGCRVYYLPTFRHPRTDCTVPWLPSSPPRSLGQ
jgi:hypothetical protein